MMEIDQPPRRGGGRELSLQPDALPEVVCDSVRLIGIAVHGEDFDGTVAIVVISFVSRKREICQVRVVPAQIDTENTAVMISNDRKETVGNSPGAIGARVR